MVLTITTNVAHNIPAPYNQAQYGMTISSSAAKCQATDPSALHGTYGMSNAMFHAWFLHHNQAASKELS